MQYPPKKITIYGRNIHKNCYIFTPSLTRVFFSYILYKADSRIFRGGFVVNKELKNISYAAIVAAAYTACSLLPGISAISYGPVQFRVSEAFMLLCLFSRSSVFGVAAGCFLTNIFTPMGANMFDLILGTLATVLAAFTTYLMRGFFIKKIYLAPLPTVIFNSVIVGSYLPYLMGGGIAVPYCMLTVGIGEAAVCYVLGIPLAKLIQKHNFLK